MSDIYAMQRANGDVFALDDHGRFRVPLFHSSSEAMVARSRNWGMLLFKPVTLNAGLLKELVPMGGGNDVDFWLVNDASINLKHGCLLQHAQLVLLIDNPTELQAVPPRRNTFDTPSRTLPTSTIRANDVWEDEGGQSMCA